MTVDDSTIHEGPVAWCTPEPDPLFPPPLSLPPPAAASSLCLSDHIVEHQMAWTTDHGAWRMAYTHSAITYAMTYSPDAPGHSRDFRSRALILRGSRRSRARRNRPSSQRGPRRP